MEWERRAASLGNELGDFNLAISYLGRGDHSEAVRRFRLLAKRGSDDALLELAHAELLGLGTRRNVQAALAKLRHVSRKRSGLTQFDRERAMRLFAETLLTGWLVPRDYRTGLRWLRRAAANGSLAARGLLEDLE